MSPRCPSHRPLLLCLALLGALSPALARADGARVEILDSWFATDRDGRERTERIDVGARVYWFVRAINRGDRAVPSIDAVARRDGRVIQRLRFKDRDRLDAGRTVEKGKRLPRAETREAGRRCYEVAFREPRRRHVHIEGEPRTICLTVGGGGGGMAGGGDMPGERGGGAPPPGTGVDVSRPFDPPFDPTIIFRDRFARPMPVVQRWIRFVWEIAPARPPRGAWGPHQAALRVVNPSETERTRAAVIEAIGLVRRRGEKLGEVDVPALEPRQSLQVGIPFRSRTRLLRECVRLRWRDGEDIGYACIPDPPLGVSALLEELVVVEDGDVRGPTRMRFYGSLGDLRSGRTDSFDVSYDVYDGMNVPLDRLPQPQLEVRVKPGPRAGMSFYLDASERDGDDEDAAYGSVTRSYDELLCDMVRGRGARLEGRIRERFCLLNCVTVEYKLYYTVGLDVRDLPRTPLLDRPPRLVAYPACLDG